MASKKCCRGCRFPLTECVCSLRAQKFLLVALVAAFGLIGCAGPQDRAIQYGTQELGLTGVSIDPLCRPNEEAIQLRGQKYDAAVPVVQQRFQLGVAQVLCCSSDSCRVSGESTLFPRPQFVGQGSASEMIEEWGRRLQQMLPSSPSLPSRGGGTT